MSDLTTPQLNALAMIGLMGWAKGCHRATHSSLYPTHYRVGRAGEAGVYVLTDEGRAAAALGPMGQAIAVLKEQGFELNPNRRNKVGHLAFRHPDGRTAYVARGYVLHIANGKDTSQTFRRISA